LQSALWNCSDILPSDVTNLLVEAGLSMKRQTYAPAARAMLENIEQNREAA
jgi:hypothetical protein